MPEYRTIAALGSSFAAGPGINPVADKNAMRSGRNYAHLLAERIGAQLTDLTVSGATTENIADTTQHLLTGASYAPQIDGLPDDVDLVTITAGGNDLHFIGTMLAVAWNHVDPTSPVARALGESADAIPEPTAADVKHAIQGLVDVILRVEDRVPGSRVLLVDYLTVLTEDSLAATPFTDSDLRQFLRIQSAVQEVFQAAAARANVDLILASRLSGGHALGSAEPWVQPFQQDVPATFGSFHPNETGMKVIADALVQTLNQ